jgi:hypothetical protein
MVDIWIPWFGGYEGLAEKMITRFDRHLAHSPLSSISNHYNSIQLYNQ